MTIEEILAGLFGGSQMPAQGQTPGAMVQAALSGVMPGASQLTQPAMSGAASPMVPPMGRTPIPRASVSQPTDSGDVMSGLGDFARGNEHGGLLEGISSLWEQPALRAKARAEQTAAKAKEAQSLSLTQKFLMASNLSAEDAAAVTANPELAKAVIPMLLKKRFGEGSKPEFKKVGGALVRINPDGSVSEAYKGAGAGGGGKYSLQPTVMRGPDGKLQVFQLGPDGQPVQSQFPEGYEYDPGAISLDKSSGKEQGTAQGKAKAALPLAMNNASTIIGSIDSILADPYLPKMTGAISGRLPNISGDAARVQSKVDQVQGKTFLQAYNDLRGGGAITEAEGSKAVAAYNRLSAMAVNDEDYVSALKEFKKQILALVEIAHVKAGEVPNGIASIEPSSTGATNAADMSDDELKKALGIGQ